MARQKKLNDEFEPNHERYRKAREAHQSPEAAETAVRAFCEEVSDLRVKYQIADLYLIYNVAVIESDESESVASGIQGFGNQSIFVSMAACAYGHEKRRHEELIRKLLANGTDC